MESEVFINVRLPGHDEPVKRPLQEAKAAELFTALPWRTFRFYKGQKHYPGMYWSSTNSDHVIYESLLELHRLLFADFDPGTQHIVAQPFLITVEIDGKTRHHIPDYLLKTSSGPVVVDVKPLSKLRMETVAFTFSWTDKAITSRGWAYEVWSEPNDIILENIRFLAGFNHSWLMNQQALQHLRSLPLNEYTIAEIEATTHPFDPAIFRASIFHLIWDHWFETDLETPLSPWHRLRRRQ